MVFLAGQGTKIFTVREQLMAAGLDDGQVIEYQETAVVHGLGRQAGVLSGRVRNTLLLNIAQDGIGVRYQPAQRPPRDDKDPIGIIAADSRLNTQVVPIIGRYTTIPARRTERFTFEAAADRHLTLEFVQFKASGTETIGQVRIPGLGKATDAEIMIDIDAGGTIIAEITNQASLRKYSYQLDNLHQAGQEWWPDDELEKALDGYAVWPLRPITDPEPVPPGVLSADNAQAYIDRFSAHIATLTQDMPALQRRSCGAAWPISWRARLAPRRTTTCAPWTARMTMSRPRHSGWRCCCRGWPIAAGRSMASGARMDG